jgi:uncharacterized protein YlxW (UPF0749 family)
MKGTITIIVLSVSLCALGALTVAFGQDDDRLSIEERVLMLERNVATLDTQLQLRTSTSGPEDRISRDFNLQTRLGDIERRVQQLSNEIQNLQRQASNAAQAANQAQRDAQMAQQMARDAQNRIR